MKSFGIGAASALLAAWALPAPPPGKLDEFGRPFDPPRRVMGLFEWEGDALTTFVERDTFAFIGVNDLQ